MGIICTRENCRFKTRHAIKVLNILILFALAIFVICRIYNGIYSSVKLIPAKDIKSGLHSIQNSHLKGNDSNNTKHIPLKVPWRFQIEDDGFVFPTRRNKELFISYIPSALHWSKQLLQFENAVVFAYLLKRTLLVPPLLRPRDVNSRNASNSTHRYQGATKSDEEYELQISRIVDFKALSKVVVLKEVSIRFLRSLPNDSVYFLCHDHRLGFWVDYIPSVENIQTWRLLRAQQFTAFPISMDDHESDLMCPGTLQYSNRWGPPMNVKPILRGILTELYDKEEDMIFFEGDTLSTRDIRFFDKQRAKTMQEIIIFHLQFTKEINKILKEQFTHIHSPYNAILSGPLSGNDTDIGVLEARLKAQGFMETSKTIFVSCREEDKKHFEFLGQLGYEVQFGLQQNRFNKNARVTKASHDVDKFCELLMCAYGSKFEYVSTTPDLYYVQHLRLQNVTMKDGLVTDKINLRWAQHTKLPKKDERILLHKKNSAQLPNDNSTQNEQSAMNYDALQNATTNESVKTSNHTETSTNGTNQSDIIPNPTATSITKRLKRKFRSKLDIMVCTFCHYIRRITGEHGCPKLKSWCP